MSASKFSSPPARSLTRRAMLAWVAGAASLALPGALRAQPARAERPRVTIAVGGKMAIYYLPLTIAERLGFFTAEGVDVELQDHAGGGLAVQSLLKGQADLAAGSFEHVLMQRQRGGAYRAFVLLGRAPQLVFGVSTRLMSDFRVIPQLKGRRIGISALGSSTHWFANQVLMRGGLAPADVEYVGLGTSASAVAALREGRIDAISHIDPVISQLEFRSDIRVLWDTRSLRATQEIYGGPMPAGCLYAPQDFVQRSANANTMQALTNAVVHALKWLQTAGPSDIVKAVPESYMYGDRAIYLSALNKSREALSPDGAIADEAVQTAARVTSRYDTGGSPVAAKLPDLGLTYTNDFVRRAKLKFML